MALTGSDIEQILVRAHADPVYFCRTFLPDWFPKEIPWVHRGLLAILLRRTDFLLRYGELEQLERWFRYHVDPEDEQSPTLPMFVVERGGETSSGSPVSVRLYIGRFTLVMIPRGFSKTTLLNAATLFMILFKERRFPFYLSETQTHSMSQLQNVKRELEQNELIRAVFGDIVGKEIWRQDQILTASGIAMMCQGRGGQVRGKNVGGRRPDLIAIDDVEDKESVKTDEQRVKTLEWLYGDVLPALPAMDPEASVVALGTLLHPDALLMRIRLDPKWTTVRFGAKLANGDMLWPERMDDAKYETERRSYARVGQLSTFTLEYDNQIRADEDQKFKDFLYGWPDPNELLHIAIAIDPAISEDKRACKSAIAVVAMTSKGRIFVLDIWAKQGASPREQIDEYFRLANRWKCKKHGVEAIAFQRALVHLMREEMFRKKQYFEILEIKHSRAKVDRIEGVLQPRYAAGYIVHAKRFAGLETELLDWPNGKMDEADVVAMAITLLDPFAAEAFDPEGDPSADDYEPLDKMIGEWRAM